MYLSDMDKKSLKIPKGK